MIPSPYWDVVLQHLKKEQLYIVYYYHSHCFTALPEMCTACGSVCVIYLSYSLTYMGMGWLFSALQRRLSFIFPRGASCACHVCVQNHFGTIESTLRYMYYSISSTLLKTISAIKINDTMRIFYGSYSVCDHRLYFCVFGVMITFASKLFSITIIVDVFGQQWNENGNLNWFARVRVVAWHVQLSQNVIYRVNYCLVYECANQRSI